MKGEPVIATKDQGKLAFGASPPSQLSLSDECDKFVYATKGREKKIKLLKLTSVSSIDPRKPTVLKFATESKSYKFEFEDERDCAIFAAGLRALAPAEATRGSIAGKKKDFLRVKVPTKPRGPRRTAPPWARRRWCRRTRPSRHPYYSHVYTTLHT